MPCWELAPTGQSGRGELVVQVDHRDRVHVPTGIRQQLGLHTTAVVSVALDRSRILIWPAASLDQLLEVVR
jgi:DNA-binding transcriptional regulator/RsmH inhibitor MraZ